MSRRTGACRGCSGRTRHADRVCARCRNDWLALSQIELGDTLGISGDALEAIRAWPGTDMGAPTIPGRYA